MSTEKPTEKLPEEEVVKKILSGQLSLYHLDAHLEPAKAADARRRIIEKLLNTKLEHISKTSLDYPSMLNKNIENIIGAIQIPVGIAGPITIHGIHSEGEFYVPMATTEGALVASINRGMKAIRYSGGAKVRIISNAMTRAPVFEFDSITDVIEFTEWIEKNFEDIKKSAEETTKHGKLKSITPFIVGNNVWLRFAFDTGDAMGMNMVTIATEAACGFIEAGFGKGRCVTISGNMCSDKKESMVNNLLGRGKTVVAEALIKENVLVDSLRTTAETANNTNIKKNLLGSARAGSITKFNGHVANIIAAIFAATGQDLAQVVGSSSGYTWTEVRGKDLYISVTLTSLEVGTVGGGTGLPTQKEALSIMGISGGGKVPGSNAGKLAEIITSAVLAGELNLIAIQTSRELGKSHKKLGRNVTT